MRALILRTLGLGGLHLSEIGAKLTEEGLELSAVVSGDGMTDALLEQAVSRIAAEPGIKLLRWQPMDEV